MKRSTDRILVSHAGTVPRPADLQELFRAGESRRDEFRKRLPSAVKEVVDRQIQTGIDVVNDGEVSKSNFTQYARSRLGGLEQGQLPAGKGQRNITARDAREFPGFHALYGQGFGRQVTAVAGGGSTPQNVNPVVLCTGPLTFIGQDAVRLDVENMTAAMAGKSGVEAYLPSIAIGTIEHWLYNQHYETDEEFLFAIADAMHEEYKAITDAGFILQLDDPDLPDGWQMFPDMSVDGYRKYASLRVEAQNHALRDIPEDHIRLHVCWGSGHGPHKNDLPLEHLADIILKVKAQVYSVEAANPRHEHEWRVWETVKLPEGKSLMPGVIGHSSDIVEHPRLIADRLITYAKLVGKENVIAGTDCGVGSRVGHAEIAWAKFEAMAEGARIASKELWGR